jgi:hypothetical protein
VIFALVSENVITMNQVISLQNVVFVDDVIPFLREAERKGITSFHISSFLDWNFEGRQKC